MTLLACFILLLVVTFVSSGGIVSVLLSWFANFLPLMFLAMAAAVIISSGHVDISTGAVMSLLGMLVVFWVGVFGADLGTVLLAHAMALVTGLAIYIGMFSIIKNQISSLIITLSMFFIARGLSAFLQICLQGVGVVCRSDDGSFMASSSGLLPSSYVMNTLGSPALSVVLALVLVAAVHLWRFHTRSGLEHVAVGQDLASAKFAGVSARKVHFLAFLIAGCLVATGTLIRLHGQTNGGWSANTGWGEELLAIAIAVIGGTRITGGRLDSISIVLAALVVYAMRDVVTNDLGLPSEMASMAFGVVMGAVVWFDARSQQGRPR